MKAIDFEIDWDSGLLTCCWSHLEENYDLEVSEGSTIVCDDCGKTMILEAYPDGMLRWREKR